MCRSPICDSGRPRPRRRRRDSRRSVGTARGAGGPAIRPVRVAGASIEGERTGQLLDAGEHPDKPLAILSADGGPARWAERSPGPDFRPGSGARRLPVLAARPGPRQHRRLPGHRVPGGPCRPPPADTGLTLSTERGGLAGRRLTGDTRRAGENAFTGRVSCCSGCAPARPPKYRDQSITRSGPIVLLVGPRPATARLSPACSAYGGSVLVLPEASLDAVQMDASLCTQGEINEALLYDGVGRGNPRRSGRGPTADDRTRTGRAGAVGGVGSQRRRPLARRVSARRPTIRATTRLCWADGDRRNVVDAYRYWTREAIVADIDSRRHRSTSRSRTSATTPTSAGWSHRQRVRGRHRSHRRAAAVEPPGAMVTDATSGCAITTPARSSRVRRGGPAERRRRRQRARVGPVGTDDAAARLSAGVRAGRPGILAAAKEGAGCGVDRAIRIHPQHQRLGGRRYRHARVDQAMG